MAKQGRKGRGKIVSKTPYNDRLKEPGEQDVELLVADDPEYQKQVRQVCDLIMEGQRSNDIFVQMLIEDNSLTEYKFMQLQKHAYVLAENELHKDREYVFQLHMERYEDLYEKNMQMVDSWLRPLDPKKDWHIMQAKYACALKALRSKEELLGLHDKSISIELNQFKATVSEPKQLRGGIPGYDISKLSMEEKKELLEIIKESRTIPIEGIHRVVIKKTVIDIDGDVVIRKQEEEIQDVEYEEMPEDVVSRIQDITPKEEEEEEHVSPIVIDNTSDKKPKNEKQLKESVNNKLLESFKQKLKKNRGQ